MFLCLLVLRSGQIIQPLLRVAVRNFIFDGEYFGEGAQPLAACSPQQPFL